MNIKVTDLEEMTAKELSKEDYVFVADVYDKKANRSISKKIQISELMKYIREHMDNYEY